MRPASSAAVATSVKLRPAPTRGTARTMSRRPAGRPASMAEPRARRKTPEMARAALVASAAPSVRDACSATTLRDRRDEWIALGAFAQLARIARESYDRIVGLVLDEIAVDGCITKAPGGGEVAGPSPVDRRKQGMKRSVLVEGYGIPLGRVLAGAQRHDSPLLAPTLDLLDDLGPLPEDITVHLDAGYDSGKTRDTLADRGLSGEIARKGEKAPIQAGQRWHVERTKCAARRPVVSPVQPGGTWREVPGSNG